MKAVAPIHHHHHHHDRVAMAAGAGRLFGDEASGLSGLSGCRRGRFLSGLWKLEKDCGRKRERGDGLL